MPEDFLLVLCRKKMTWNGFTWMDWMDWDRGTAIVLLAFKKEKVNYFYGEIKKGLK